MKSLISTMLLLVSLTCMYAEVTVVSQTQDELLLNFILPEYKIEFENIMGTNWQSIVCDDGSVHAEPGFPELRVFSEAVAIPINGSISIQVSNVKSTILKNINLKPTYKMVLQDEEVDYVFYQDVRAYSNPQLYPAELVQSGETAFIGDRNFAPLRIFPFQYRAATQELVVSTSFSIRVIIHGTKTATANWQMSENPLDSVADSFFLNNASSKAWRVPRKTAVDYQAPKNGTTQANEIQLIVNQEGIYKVSYSMINDYINAMIDSLGNIMAWSPSTVDPRNLELRDEYGKVPIYFSGEADGNFDPEDYFEFYGDRHYGDDGYSDNYTAENVYTLYLSDGLGARMAVENGGLIVADASQYIVPDSYEHTVHFEQQIIYDKLGNGWSSSNPKYFKEDTWFWRKINAPDLAIVPFELQYPMYSNLRTASAKIALMGLTYAEGLTPGQYDHDATVRINQAMVNTHTWTGQTEQIFLNRNPIANSYLHHGTNHMYISLSGNTASGHSEQVLLDYMDLTYWREYKTSEDKIKFSKPSNRPAGLYQFQLEGFSSSDVSVYKLGSSIITNCQIEPFNLDGLAPWTVTIQDSVSSSTVKYYALTEDKKMSPISLRINLPSDLKNPNNSADVILVSNRELLNCEGTDLLVSLWEAENHTVARVDYQDIFDEFNHGIRSAESLKDFFSYAYNYWSSPQLKHIVLLGEGVSDERDNSPARKYALIPVKMAWTWTLGATACDPWYACLVGDDIVPDVAITRINVWQPQQVLDYAQKAESYRNNLQTQRLWNSHLTFSAGGRANDSEDTFAKQSERIRRKNVPDHYRVSRVYTRTSDSDFLGGTFNLLEQINSGTQYLQFIGHGGGRIWSDYNLFNFNNVATLNNPVYPIVLSLACYVSAFDTNGASSLSEALVVQPGKGAIATLGFSGLGLMAQNEDWGMAFTEALFKHDFPTLGQTLQYSLARFYTTTSASNGRYALINGTAMLGDHLIKPRKPVADIPVSLSSHVLQPGEVLQVNAQFPTDVTSARLYIMKKNETCVNVAYDMPVINGNFNASYTAPVADSTKYSRIAYVAGYSPTQEYVGKTVFGVGRAAIMHHSTVPESPAWQDSVAFIATVFSNEPINTVRCRYTLNIDASNVSWVNLPMQPHPTLENAYISTAKMPPQVTGKEVSYKYEITTPSGSYESFVYNHVTRGPDLVLEDIRLESTNNGQALKILVSNCGDAASIDTDLRLDVIPEDSPQYMFSTQTLAPVQVNEKRWETIPLAGLNNGIITFEVRVNLSNAFPEWHTHTIFGISNLITLTASFNYFSIGDEGAVISSVDGNVSCEIPSGLVPAGQSSVFHITGLGTYTASDQPGISEIKLHSYDLFPNSIASNAYEIKTLDPTLTDSTGTLINHKKMKLSFFYSNTDPETQEDEADNSFKIYRWNETGKKWLLQGGNVSSEEDMVVFEVSRQGIYTIYNNKDRIRPSIDVNVQDQEFTIGGYISGKGVISLLLSDANGIDVFDSTIRLFLNGDEVPKDEYVATVNLDNLNRIPIKYQLNATRGNYTLVVDCKDVNGNANSREIQFIVNDRFDIINIGNYPNPVLGRAQDPKNDGRTRFTYVLTDQADGVSIKVYTVAGRLVKSFKNLPTGVGYHEFPRTLYGWDCKDEANIALANGVYFYKVTAVKGNKRIEKTMKMAILK